MEQRQANYFIWITIVLLWAGEAIALSESGQQIKSAIHAQVSESLTSYIPDFSNSKLKIHFEPTLNTLTFKVCDNLLTLKPFKNAPLGREIVHVSCDSQKRWALYVPVQISYQHTVLVTNSTVANGSVIKDSDLTMAVRDLGLLRQGYYLDTKDVVGFESRRQLNPGTVITSNILQPAKLIQRGDNVTIQASAGKLKVRMTGEAMIDGRKGQQITVKNLSSKRLIKAVVIAKGLVEIP